MNINTTIESATSDQQLALDQQLDLALVEARTLYLEKRPGSVSAFNESISFMPGGNTRTVLFHGPAPLRIVSGSGCQITDADGFQYVNFLGEYTAGLFGHNHPVIRRAIDKALDQGISLSGHNVDEMRLSRLMCERFPSIELVRFTNSGTEANLLAISIARHATGRGKVMVFQGGYHGGLLYFRNGNMAINAPFDYVLGEYNNLESVREMIRAHASDLACVLIEPMQGSGGCIPASVEFLGMIREESRKSGAILIFDEVMTSRLSTGGLQQVHNIHPDLTTLGKYLGGGMSFGAFGGNKDIMELFDPTRENAIPHAGTFNNNSLTMAAGATAMEEVLTNQVLDELNARGEQLRLDLNSLSARYDSCFQFIGIGSLLGLHTTCAGIQNVKDLEKEDDRIMELVFLNMLERGYYIARRGFISLMLTIGNDEIVGFKKAFEDVLTSRGDLFKNTG